MATQSPKQKEDYLSGVLEQRLAEIHCEQLPPVIRRKLTEHFISEAQARIDRLVSRSITVPSIARVFTDTAKEERANHAPKGDQPLRVGLNRAHGVGVQGEDFSLPPDEWDLPTEAESESSQIP